MILHLEQCFVRVNGPQWPPLLWRVELVFLSQLDVKVARSGFLDLPFKDNDSVMVDKVFTFQDLLPLGVSLNIPPLIGSSRQMPTEDVVKTQEIASIGIHLERGINKIKIFHILDRVIPLHQSGLVNQMLSLCAILCNAQPTLFLFITVS